jgi:septal ring factor EnvC (AmiA/AmiB activator)
MLTAAGLLLAGVLLWEPVRADTAAVVEKNVSTAINVRQASQKEQEKWDARRAELAAEYDRLAAENEILEAENQRLSGQSAALGRTIAQLEQEKTQTRQVREELMPFLADVQADLTRFVTHDMPFLPEERAVRLEKLAALMEDAEIPVAEKFRKTMEALSIEAEYGNTIEVYHDRIRLGEQQVSGQIFRLGRISLYYLSLDGQEAAVFDVGEQQWRFLDDRFVPEVAAAVEIALKRRTAGILDLPLGRLAIP